MARTNAPDVQAVLMRDYDANERPSLTPFIRSANLLTTRLATYAAAKGVSVSDAELEAIECWLAAGRSYGANDRP